MSYFKQWQYPLPSISPDAQSTLIEIAHSIYQGLISLFLPTLFLYLALYALVKQQIKLFEKLAMVSTVGFLISIAIGVMKSLDFYARRHSPPKYTNENAPPDRIIALLYLIELRYESFTPNHVRTPPAPLKEAATKTRTRTRPKKLHFNISELNLSEPINLVIHILFFLILQQFFPQSNSTVLAVQILLAVYIIWEIMQLFLRYRTSPPLFGPIYAATSLGSFWRVTWHSAFASPCHSLVYSPLRRYLPIRYGIPVSFARGMGIIASFMLMGLFHVYGLAPLLPLDALLRISAFFLLNGIGIVMEEAMWGRQTHWGKTLLAWVFELAIASWTVEGLSVPRGLRNLSWANICNVGNETETMFA
ncbi:hypothetical protein LOZ12_005944 [Ophidiomyces ophidiicola]|uniref:Uncharacterized protein n=1 Tax=Ophidiomyces ophidiicola TaxID=1387563 RepID=A0ACB8US06_9EURO|nr:uncharacterized protein LOZ57_003679 [Ophidiomyces ophidiicola]KAI1946424.1 hypothetical protein LOZ57_003679 [Ophidiomyces ophidiicola]KAI1949939.1 hypothetical protein LOZ62_002109 [Ophidiomyces ophidiicola]KAI2057900.1 hypothetical protein LOZ43_002834 [Ophidiomyces ophidiicola]KAI2086734.1 hypothetical protein LOZ36_003201 [Ophidiomyces ophidiicola]KAI2087814.1 hypothetical protein LOZ35_006001 [Ophidiomyces ophidiicola]